MRAERTAQLLAAVLLGVLVAPLGATVVHAAPAVDRLAGETRYGTAVQISKDAYPDGAPIAFLATGASYPDALAAAPAAASHGGPLLLTQSDRLPSAVRTELARLDPDLVVIVGGTAVVTAAVARQIDDLGLDVERVAGADRYATSRAIVSRFFSSSEVAYVATGENFPDALAAGAAAGAIDAPVVLVPGRASSVTSATRSLLTSLGVTTTYIAGGTAVVSAGVQRSLEDRGGTVVRLAGTDRYETAVAINQHAFAAADRAFLATGSGFADALAGAAYAGALGQPLYSTPPSCVPRTARDDLVTRLDVDTVTLLGGSAVLGSGVASLTSCTTLEQDRAESSAALQQKLQARISQLAGTYSVTVRELEGLQTSVSIRGTTMQEPASVMKLFAVYGVLNRVDSGQFELSDPTRSGVSIADCIRVTIHVSDNLCHWDLVALVGQQTLNNQFCAEGYTRTVYEGRGCSGTSYSSKRTTTNDVALLLTRLETGELLSPELTDYYLDLLETQVWRHRIPAGVQRGVPIANKTGYLWVSTGYIHADTAIISGSNGPLVLTIIGSRNATANGVRDLGRIVYEHVNGPVTSGQSYGDRNLETRQSTTYYRYGSTSTPLGTLPAGTRVSAYASARTWYQVRLSSGSLVYVRSADLRNYYDYPRR